MEEETWKLEAMGSDRQGCLRRSLEQDVVDHRLVGVGEVGDRCWPCVDDMEVGHGQQFRFPVLEPVARRRPLTVETMAVATTVVGDDSVAAFLVLTARNMPADRHCEATVHHFMLEP